jgi:hypothetical protein
MPRATVSDSGTKHYAICSYLFTCVTARARPGSVEVSGGMLSLRLSGKSVDLRTRLTYRGRDWPTWR